MTGNQSTKAFVPNARQWVLAAGGALLLALLAFAVWYSMLRTPMAPAFTNLREGDAALIIDELKRQKTAYALTDEGKTILVPADEVDATRIAILGGDLPLKGTVGFELFNKSDMGLTEFAQKINYQRALQGELARTLMSMAPIETARVHLTLPEDGIFQGDRAPAKASVTITTKTGATLDPPSIVGIQRLIASAVEGLDAANVVVLDGIGAQLSAETFNQPEPAAEENGTPTERAFAKRIKAVVQQLTSDPAMRVTVWATAAEQPRSDNHDTVDEDKRHFPLRITIALSSPPRPDLRDALIPLLESAVGYDPSQGDSLNLIVLPAGSPYHVGQPTVQAAPRTASPVAAAPPTPALPPLPLVIAFAVIAIGGLALWQRRGGKTIATRRDDFAARLRHLLDEDERLRDGQA